MIKGPGRSGCARLLIATCWLVACGDGADQRRELRQLSPPVARVQGVARGNIAIATVPAASLPNDSGPFWPSLMRPDADGQIDVASFSNVEACSPCHAEQTEQWRQSAHAHASFDNPWYRASVDHLRASAGMRASQHCGGCHDPLLLLSSKMQDELELSDPLATVGITCLICHSASSANPDGNGSLELSGAPVPMPEPGDPESLARHRERLAMPALRDPRLCGACHRGFVGPQTGNRHHLFGMDDLGAWGSSVFADSRARTLEPFATRACRDCHMALAPHEASQEGISHRFVGAHSALFHQTGDAVARQALVETLRGAVRIVAPVLWVAGKPVTANEPTALPAPGTQMALDVTVRSLAVGHAFPGGLKDMQDTWLEVVIRDGAGRVVARSGTSAARGNDPNAYYLRAAVVDETGRIETRHQVSHFGTVVYDHTVPAAGARTVRYRFVLPNATSAPLVATIRLKHRKHREELRAAACAASRSGRGRAMAAAGAARGQIVIDGCEREPVTLVATHQVRFFQSVERTSEAQPLWSQLYDHALGLSSTVQERLDEPRQVAELALAHMPPEQTARDRANVLCLLGMVAARQGRVEAAEDLADRAHRLVGAQPAVLRVRADANLQVWRFEVAERALRALVALSPRDTAAHRDLARARLSIGDPLGAQYAARRGLALQPRDEGLLRVQAIALAALGHPDAEAARRAYLRYRVADEDTARKLACDRRSSTCSRDRMPVVTIAAGP